MTFLQFEDFAGRLNESFEIDLGESKLPMVLTGAQLTQSFRYPGQIRTPFNLTFGSYSQLVLPQRIYRFRNEVLGELDIFIVPTARNKDGILYNATFN